MFRIGELLIILVLVFIIFGAGKLPNVMGEIGKGIRNLRSGLDGKDDKNPENESSEEPKHIDKK